MPITAAAGEEGDGDKPSAGKGRKVAARKAKPAKRVGGVLPDYLLPDVASVDVESEAGRSIPYDACAQAPRMLPRCSLIALQAGLDK